MLERGVEAEGAAFLGPGEREALAEFGKGEVLGLRPLQHGLGDVGGQESERDDPGDVARGQAFRLGDGPDGGRLPGQEPGNPGMSPRERFEQSGIWARWCVTGRMSRDDQLGLAPAALEAGIDRERYLGAAGLVEVGRIGGDPDWSARRREDGLVRAQY